MCHYYCYFYIIIIYNLIYIEQTCYCWWYTFIGFSHTVEILQTVVFFYLGISFCFLLLLTWSNDLKRFFFFSELAWLCLFGLCLALTFWSQTTLALTNAFVILIFTAIEAVTLACLLLITSESAALTKII